MNNNLVYILPQPQVGQGASAPQSQAQPILYQQPQVQGGANGNVTVQLPLGQPPNSEEKIEVEQNIKRSTKADLAGAYKMLTKHLDQVQKRNGELYSMVLTRDNAIKTLSDNETYFRSEVGYLQHKLATLESEVQCYRGGMETIPKAIHDEVLEQNRIIGGNNQLLFQQNEELQMEAEQAKAEGSQLLSENHALACNIVELSEKLKSNAENNSAAGDTLTQKNQELLSNLVDQKQMIEALEEEKKILEDKLSSSETLCNSTGKELNNRNAEIQRLIPNLTSALGSARAKVDSLTEENQNLKLKIHEFELEKERMEGQQAASELEKLKKQPDEEKERVRELKFALHDKKEEVEALQKQLKEEKNQSQRKSEMISSLKKIMGKNGQGEKFEESAPMKILKMEKEHLTTQLDARLEEIRKLEQKLKSLGEQNKAMNDELTKQLIKETVEVNLAQMVEAADNLEFGNGNDISLHYEDIVSEDDLPITPEPEVGNNQDGPRAHFCEESPQEPTRMNQAPDVEELSGASNDWLVLGEEVDDLDIF